MKSGAIIFLAAYNDEAQRWRIGMALPHFKTIEAVRYSGTLAERNESLRRKTIDSLTNEVQLRCIEAGLKAVRNATILAEERDEQTS